MDTLKNLAARYDAGEPMRLSYTAVHGAPYGKDYAVNDTPVSLQGYLSIWNRYRMSQTIITDIADTITASGEVRASCIVQRDMPDCLKIADMDAIAKTLASISAGNPWRGACNTALPVHVQNNKRRILRIAGMLKNVGILPGYEYAHIKNAWAIPANDTQAKERQKALPGQVMATASRLLTLIS